MKMKRLHFFFLLLAGILLTACGGDDDVTSGGDTPKPVTPSTPTSWSLEITSPVTRGLNGNESGITPTWETTDRIYVYYGDQRVGVLHPKEHKNSASEYVQLEGNLDTPVSGAYSTSGKLSFYYQCDKGFSNYTGQDGTLATIASSFDYHKAENVPIADVDAVNRKVTVEQFNLKPQQAIARFSFTRPLVAGDVITITGAKFSVSATLKAPVAENTGYVDVALPLTATAASPTLTFDIKRDNDENFYKTIMADKSMQNGKTYSAKLVLAVQLAGTWWATRNINDDGNTPTSVKPFTQNEYDVSAYFTWGKTKTQDYNYINDLNVWPSHTTIPPYDKLTQNQDIHLSAEDDAATQLGGNAWRMPTQYEAASLAYDPSIPVVEREGYLMNGVYGLKISDINNSAKYIFLPANGFWYDDRGGYTVGDPGNESNECHYWTSSYWTYEVPKEGAKDRAARFYFNAPLGDPVGSASVWGAAHNCGCCIRPVLNIP